MVPPSREWIIARGVADLGSLPTAPLDEAIHRRSPIRADRRLRFLRETPQAPQFLYGAPERGGLDESHRDPCARAGVAGTPWAPATPGQANPIVSQGLDRKLKGGAFSGSGSGAKFRRCAAVRRQKATSHATDAACYKNGGCRYINDVDPNAGEIVASFDGRSVTHGFGELDMLAPASFAGIRVIGSVVARRLAENAEVSVLLLEAGGSDDMPSIMGSRPMASEPWQRT